MRNLFKGIAANKKGFIKKALIVGGTIVGLLLVGAKVSEMGKSQYIEVEGVKEEPDKSLSEVLDPRD